jgi:hypothetical protein
MEISIAREWPDPRNPLGIHWVSKCPLREFERQTGYECDMHDMTIL